MFNIMRIRTGILKSGLTTIIDCYRPALWPFKFFDCELNESILFFRYKELFEEGKIDKALKSCQEYLGKMEDLKLKFPHRNYELAAIALCSCLWSIATRHNL